MRWVVCVDRMNNVMATNAQKDAGNYKMAKHLRWAGFAVAIETAKGQNRTGTGKDGTEWSVTMPVDYGYIKATKGVDGDHVDVFLGPDRNPAKAPVVWVLEQRDAKTGKFDEHKLLAGFRSKAAAVRAYLKSFTDNARRRMGKMTAVPVEGLRAWLKDEGLAMKSLAAVGIASRQLSSVGERMQKDKRKGPSLGERTRGALVGATAGTALLGTLAGTKAGIKVPNKLLKRVGMKPGRLRGGKRKINLNPARLGGAAGALVGGWRPPQGKAQEIVDAGSGYVFIDKSFAALAAEIRELREKGERDTVDKVGRAALYGGGLVGGAALVNAGVKAIGEGGRAIGEGRKRARAAARATLRKSNEVASVAKDVMDKNVRRTVDEIGAVARNARYVTAIGVDVGKGYTGLKKVGHIIRKPRGFLRMIRANFRAGMKEGAAAPLDPAKLAKIQAKARMKAAVQRGVKSMPRIFAELAMELRELREADPPKKRSKLKRAALIGGGAIAGAALGARTLPRLVKRGRLLRPGETTTGKILYTDEGLTTIAELLGKKHKLGKAAAKGSKVAGIANKVDDFFGIPQRHYGLGLGGKRVAEKTKAHRARVTNDEGFARGKRVHVDSDVTPKSEAAAAAMGERFDKASKGKRMCLIGDNCEHFARDVGGQGKKSYQTRAIVGGAGGGAAVGGAAAAIATRRKKQVEKELGSILVELRNLGREDQLRWNAPGSAKHQRWADPTEAFISGNPVTGAHGKPVEVEHRQVLGSTINKAKRARTGIQRGAYLARDVADTVQGKERRDTSGRLKRKEWQKQWFKNAVWTAGIAGGLGATTLARRHARRHPTSAIGSRVAKAEKKMRAAKDWVAKKADGAADDFLNRFDLAAIVQELRELAPPMYAGYDPYYSAPGWDVRDARGKSARVFVPGSKKRQRRQATWSEKKDNQRKILIGAGAAAAAAALASGYRLGSGHWIPRKKGSPAAVPKAAVPPAATNIFPGDFKPRAA